MYFDVKVNFRVWKMTGLPPPALTTWPARGIEAYARGCGGRGAISRARRPIANARSVLTNIILDLPGAMFLGESGGMSEFGPAPEVVRGPADTYLSKVVFIRLTRDLDILLRLPAGLAAPLCRARWVHSAGPDWRIAAPTKAAHFAVIGDILFIAWTQVHEVGPYFARYANPLGGAGPNQEAVRASEACSAGESN